MPETFTTKQLAGAAGVTTTQTTVYTVPASTKTVITSIVVCNTSTTQTVALSINAGVIFLLLTRPIAPLETLVLHFNAALAAGTNVQLAADITGLLHVILSGVEIT